MALYFNYVAINLLSGYVLAMMEIGELTAERALR
jgi:hypothetical protein